MNTFFSIIGFSLILTVAISMMVPLIKAQPPALSVPVDCSVGKDCFIQNYVDLDASDGSHDYRCGPLTYDGHTGIDFRTRNHVQMDEGVNVLAAADGEVLRLRDGMADVSIRAKQAPHIEGSECGNGVVIRHNGGFETQYCHLKQGSIIVEQGQSVKRGEVLGEIGLSGKTEFPHLHFLFRNKDNEVIDPFAGPMASADCDLKGRLSHYWQREAKKAMPYVATTLLSYGFSDRRVDAESARRSEIASKRLATEAEAIIFWVDAMGLHDGDTLIMHVRDPDDVALVNYSTTIAGNKAQWFQYVGKRRGRSPWPEGTYTARYRVLRGNDSPQAVIDETMTLDVVDTY